MMASSGRDAVARAIALKAAGTEIAIATLAGVSRQRLLGEAEAFTGLVVTDLHKSHANSEEGGSLELVLLQLPMTVKSRAKGRPGFAFICSSRRLLACPKSGTV